VRIRNWNFRIINLLNRLTQVTPYSLKADGKLFSILVSRCSTQQIIEQKAKGRKYNLIKYFIWVPWIGIIISSAILAGGYHKIDILFLTESGISVDRPTAYILYYTVVGGITLLALTLGKRAFCRYICWMAPFMIIGTKIKNKLKWPSLHLEADKQKCTKCKTCERECTMSLEPWKMVENDSMTDAECILCGNCIDTCPNGVIKYSFSSPK